MIILWHTPFQQIFFLELDIKEFMAFYRGNFPRDRYPKATILPKMHLLEDHTVPWLKAYHLGSGIMGEQGAESIHAHLNRLETTYAGIPSKLLRLKQLFKMYIVEVNAHLQTLKPVIQTRKRKRQQSAELNLD